VNIGGRRQMGLLCADSLVPSLLTSLHLSLHRLSCCSGCEALWCNIEHVVKDSRPHIRAANTQTHREKDNGIKMLHFSKVPNYCRAVWGSGAERTKKHQGREKYAFSSRFNFPVGYERRGRVQQINSKVCLCQCRVWLGIREKSRVNAIHSSSAE